MGRLTVVLRQGGQRERWSRRRIVALFGALASLACATMVSGEADLAKAIAWRDGATIARPSMAEPDMMNVAHEVRELGHRHVVVQFARPVTADARAALAQRGIDLLAPLGGDAYFASLNDEPLRIDAMAVIAPLQRLDPIDTDWKLHEQLAGGLEPAWAVVRRSATPDGRSTQPIVALYVLLQRDADAVQAQAQLEALGATITTTMRTLKGFVIELPLALVREAASLDAVQWIEPALPALGGQNDLARVSIGVNVLQDPPYSLDGNAVKVMEYDAGTVDGSHPDLAGRVTVHDNVAASQHSTHVAGIIGGTGLQSGGLYRGMAPNVLIESYGLEPDGGSIVLYDDIGDIEHDYDDAINNVGVSLANNSIGSNIAVLGLPCELEGDYSVVSAVVDSIAHGAFGRELPIMWAAGNERIFPSFCGTGWRTVPPPATAKNSIVVGAAYSDFDLVTSFSSYGPVDDGRIRPDVCAPGCELAGDNGVTSTNLGGGYIPLCGTSMATPAVTGVVALMLQDHRDSAPAGAPEPSPAMIKAVLVQTALDLWNVGPDYRTGYGLVQADEAVQHMRDGNCIEGEVGQGDVWEAPIMVVPGTNQLRATVAWVDPPGTPNVNGALVNDLDLMIVGPDGEFFPWTLDPAHPGNAAVRTHADHLNNVEQVAVENPTPGIWQIQVIGGDVPEGPQRFAIASGSTIVRIEITPPDGAPMEVDAGVTAQFDVDVEAIGQALVAQTLRVHTRQAGQTIFTSQPLKSFGGLMYAARLPAAPCGETIEYYFSAAGSISGTQYEPALGPDDPYRARVVSNNMIGAIDLDVPESSANQSFASDSSPHPPLLPPTASGPPYAGEVHIESHCIHPRPVGDLDDNFRVDGFDLANLLYFWGTDEISADLDGSWIVDGTDLAELLSFWTP